MRDSLNILFLTEPREDYLADSILHGLVKLGHNVVDFPRKDILYRDSFNLVSKNVRGAGFTLYSLLTDSCIDRTLIHQRLQNSEFDLVILGQVWRQWGQLLDLSCLLQNIPTILLDGDDDTRLFHWSATRIRRYGLHRFPIRSGKCFYFKRELQELGSLSRRCIVLPANFSIPSDKILPLNTHKKAQRLASHCVDPEIAFECGLPTSYAFSSEQEYYLDMARSRFAVTTKRGGWDCLRHYEIAAAGALPCFKSLELKPSVCAPHGLQPGINCLSYHNWTDLDRQMSALEIEPKRYAELLLRSRDWVLNYTTTASAQRLLDAVLVR